MFQGDDILAFLLLKQHCSDDSEHSLREHVFLGRDVLLPNLMFSRTSAEGVSNASNDSRTPDRTGFA